MKKILAIITLTILFITSGCSKDNKPNPAKLPEVPKSKLEINRDKIINYFNSTDTKSLNTIFNYYIEDGGADEKAYFEAFINHEENKTLLDTCYYQIKHHVKITEVENRIITESITSIDFLKGSKKLTHKEFDTFTNSLKVDNPLRDFLTNSRSGFFPEEKKTPIKTQYELLEDGTINQYSWSKNTNDFSLTYYKSKLNLNFFIEKEKDCLYKFQNNSFQNCFFSNGIFIYNETKAYLVYFHNDASWKVLATDSFSKDKYLIDTEGSYEQNGTIIPQTYTSPNFYNITKDFKDITELVGTDLNDDNILSSLNNYLNK